MSSFGLIDLVLTVANWNFFISCCSTSLVVSTCLRFLKFAWLIMLVFFCLILILFLFSWRSLIFLIDPGGSPIRFLQSCDFDR